MGIAADIVGGVVELGKRVIKDPQAQAQFELEATKLAHEREIEALKIAQAEAQSNDPWTSRARPSFLYVLYVLILFGIPMGFLSAVDPAMAVDVAHGFGAWLKAIPEAMWAVFGTCFSVYSIGRTAEKFKGVAR
jgi:hypothetical protein